MFGQILTGKKKLLMLWAAQCIAAAVFPLVNLVLYFLSSPSVQVQLFESKYLIDVSVMVVSLGFQTGIPRLLNEGRVDQTHIAPYIMIIFSIVCSLAVAGFLINSGMAQPFIYGAFYIVGSAYVAVYSGFLLLESYGWKYVIIKSLPQYLFVLFFLIWLILQAFRIEISLLSVFAVSGFVILCGFVAHVRKLGFTFRPSLYFEARGHYAVLVLGSLHFPLIYFFASAKSDVDFAQKLTFLMMAITLAIFPAQLLASYFYRQRLKGDGLISAINIKAQSAHGCYLFCVLRPLCS